MKKDIFNNFSHSSTQSGFVLLYSMMLSSMLLAITLGVINIAFRELKFATSGKATNEAFFAADTGAECALHYNKSTVNRFESPDPGGAVNCAVDIPVFSGDSTLWSYSFIVDNLGADGDGCAKVNVQKDASFPPTKTTITSVGYNNGGEDCIQDAFSVERKIILTY